MPDTGPHPVGQVNCPSCGRLVYINQDGRLRHHHADGSKTACPASRQPAPGGSVLVRKLRDGVVIKVRHAAGTFADDAVTDELVLLETEWAALAVIAATDAAAAERDRLADLADLCRATYRRDDGGPALSFAWCIRQEGSGRA